MKLISWFFEKVGMGLVVVGLFVFAMSSKANLEATKLLSKVLKDAANAKS
ncbi:hypothetical protein [Piscinibacter defluvii]|nr:hypothetical protein [Piscinibacter defluvii]